MVWSNQAVDKITIPASVPIGGAQDGVILSGYDIPAELQALHITAVVIFQRGDYPSQGSQPEAKYYFMGMTKIGYNNTAYTIGTVIDTKTSGLVAVDNMNLPIQFRSLAVPGAGNVWTANSAFFHHMDFSLGFGDHAVASRIRTKNSVPHAGQTLTANSWYNVALNAGWIAQPFGGYAQGVEFKLTATNVMHIRGGIQAPATGAVSGVTICNIGTNDFFPTFPSVNQIWPAVFQNAGTGVCDLRLFTNGDLQIGSNLTVPPNNAQIFFSQTYENYQ